MEAGLANLTEPGDKVIVIHAGFFGARIAEMRAPAPSSTWSNSPRRWVRSCRWIRWRRRSRANPDTKLVAVVHAETSTGVRYPLRSWAPDREQRRPMLC